MDNKPLEGLAENYIKTRLAKAKIKYLKPNYDTEGTDLVLLNPLNKHLSKQVIIQSKGRNLTNNQSSIEIHKDYIVSNFICFLYLEVDGDDHDNFYIFFNDDIKDWNLSNGKYKLSIPKGFENHDYFNLHIFNAKSHVRKIRELLSDAPLLRQSYVHFEEMNIKEILFEMWKKYDALPDLNLVKGLYDDFYNLSGSYPNDIFLIYSIAMHIENMEYRSLDGFMQDLFIARNLSNPISESVTIHNPERIKDVYSPMAIVYSRLRFGQVQITYDGIEYKGLYCYIGDREDHVEALVFDNGNYVCFGERKHLPINTLSNAGKVKSRAADLNVMCDLIEEVRLITREKMMPWIVHCLESRGGAGWPKDVAKHVWENHEQELKESGDILYTWQYDLRWAAQKLRDEKVLKPVDGRNDLPWELAEL